MYGGLSVENSVERDVDPWMLAGIAVCQAALRLDWWRIDVSGPAEMGRCTGACSVIMVGVVCMDGEILGVCCKGGLR
jgi:hypothetical protein